MAYCFTKYVVEGECNTLLSIKLAIEIADKNRFGYHLNPVWMLAELGVCPAFSSEEELDKSVKATMYEKIAKEMLIQINEQNEL